ncbi:hypothetical protein AB0J38_40035 [Streptomyces sp. NPDC050095]|uniref:hypothetical protein n=1 Tax=unclassified Streptomyces TaxID=2593676 RepID=UPI003445C1DA
MAFPTVAGTGKSGVEAGAGADVRPGPDGAADVRALAELPLADGDFTADGEADVDADAEADAEADADAAADSVACDDGTGRSASLPGDTTEAAESLPSPPPPQAEARSSTPLTAMTDLGMRERIPGSTK